MSPDRTRTGWRRGWDSNPRDPFGPNGFQDRRLQPLGHPSVFKLFKHSNLRPASVTVLMVLMPIAASWCKLSHFCHSTRRVSRLRHVLSRDLYAYNAWSLSQSSARAIVALSQCPRLDPKDVKQTYGAACATSHPKFPPSGKPARIQF